MSHGGYSSAAIAVKEPSREIMSVEASRGENKQTQAWRRNTSDEEKFCGGTAHHHNLEQRGRDR